jgi:membrane-bound metal-dependent hydrolase YbcI (DUF457 family)
MFLRTHLLITLFFVLLFFQYIPNFVLFLPIALFATIIPDIDNKFSRIGHYKLSRIFNFFVKHRGITHSFTFLFIISFFIFLFFKEILFAFVLGYSLHLLADSLTIKGIMPLYPFKKKLRGKIKTGGIIENLIFVILLSGNLFLVFTLIYPIF